MQNKDAYHIGMFDSGIGGLTVMQQLKQLLPQESILYFGDTARIPYGGKSQATIIRYSIENTIFLMEKNIKLLVIACNTASAFATYKLHQIFNIPIIGVIEPGAKKAVQVTQRGCIAVLGTKGTIHSGVYQKEIKRLLPEAEIIPIACPLFVPFVEEYFLDHPATKLIVKEYLEPLKDRNVDTILLGCTHYLLLKELIQEVMGPNVQLVDSALTCAEEVARVLKQNQIEACTPATYRYYVSDDPEKFREQGEKLFGHKINHVESWISSN